MIHRIARQMLSRLWWAFRNQVNRITWSFFVWGSRSHCRSSRKDGSYWRVGAMRPSANVWRFCAEIPWISIELGKGRTLGPLCRWPR